VLQPDNQFSNSSATRKRYNDVAFGKLLIHIRPNNHNISGLRPQYGTKVNVFAYTQFDKNNQKKKHTKINNMCLAWMRHTGVVFKTSFHYSFRRAKKSEN